MLPSGSYAVAIIYTKQSGYPVHVSVRLGDIGLANTQGYSVTEVFEGQSMGHYSPTSNFTTYVNPSGIFMVRATVVSKIFKDCDPNRINIV